VVPSARCISSRDAGWTSLLIELHTGVSSSDPYTSIATPDQIIGVAMSGRYSSEFLHAGRWRRGVYEPGAICLHRRGEVARYRFGKREYGNASTAMLYLPHGQLQAAADQLRRAGQRSADVALNAAVDRDPAIFQMAATLLQAMERGADNLYAETAAAWLAVHVASRHRGYLDVDDNRTAGPITDRRLARVIEYMSAQFAEPLTLEELAATAGVSKFHFTRLFRSKVGRTPHAFLTDIRLDSARRMLVTTDLSIGEVGLACGYRDASHFSTTFAAKYGASPTAFRLQRKIRGAGGS
jgi:AraC family transcriptional regulator